MQWIHLFLQIVDSIILYSRGDGIITHCENFSTQLNLFLHRHFLLIIVNSLTVILVVSHVQYSLIDLKNNLFRGFCRFFPYVYNISGVEADKKK